MQMNLKLEIFACDFKVSYEEPDGNMDTKDLQVISHEIVKRRNSPYQMEISNSTWQGVNFLNRIEDENLIKDYFGWLKKVENVPNINSIRIYVDVLPAITNKMLSANTFEPTYS